MRKKFLNIVMIALLLTTVAFLMDGDVKEPSMLMRFVEFFAMTGIFTLIISVIYFSVSYILRNRQKVSV